jgi:hypothetical protein
VNGGQIDVTSFDDGWRRIEGDKAAPQIGHCWLANETKRMAWESWSGVKYQPLSDEPPYWWKFDHRDQA